MTRVIINADDFGLSAGVNYGIIDAYKYGILTSTTIMANMQATHQAIELALAHPKLAVGIHLTLSVGKPILNLNNTLTDESGKFHHINTLSQPIELDYDELYNEWDAQIQHILSYGLVLSHIDSHHHVHALPVCEDVVIKLAHKYNLPIRPLNNNDSNGNTVEHFSKTLDDIAKKYSNLTNTDYLELKKELKKYHTIEYMCHPAYVDNYLMNNSSYNLVRAQVTDFLINSSFAQSIKEYPEIEMINYFNLSIN